MRRILPYVGLPVIAAALYVMYKNNADVFHLLRLAQLLVFGYIAAINDLQTKEIPNRLILSMLAVWLVMMSVQMLWDITYAIDVLVDSIIGFLIAGGMFLLVYIISRKGLGGGDVKFMAAAGLYLGYSAAIGAILYGTILAAVVGGSLLLLKKIKRKDTMPLAPFLFIGMVITTFLQ